MLLLFETVDGYVIFKILEDEIRREKRRISYKLRNPVNLYTDFQTAEEANQILTLKHFEKFQSMEKALESISNSIKSEMSMEIKNLLMQFSIADVREDLALADAKLGDIISSNFNVNCIASTAINKLNRYIGCNLSELLEELRVKELTSKSHGFIDGLSRFKLKFSVDKIDIMIIQAIGALDVLDEEMNTLIMKVKEFYDWHFPELVKIVCDDIAYVKTVLAIGFKEDASNTELSNILSEEQERKVKDIAGISMGIDITEDDLTSIKNLCKEVLELQKYQIKLHEYLKNRMTAIAPNLTSLVGEMVGARLIAHAGSLMKLGKLPASTLQMFGAEKALFSALKRQRNTPKYGCIYHAEMIQHTNISFRGKMTRMLAGKASLASRNDAFGGKGIGLAIEHRTKLERALEALQLRKANKIGKSEVRKGKYKKIKFQYKQSGDSAFNGEVSRKR